jgi:hypothetical protein
MRKFGIKDKCVKTTNFKDMPTKKKANEPSSEDFETLKLKKRIAELEKQLQTAEMKAIAFSTMVDIAEKEFNPHCAESPILAMKKNIFDKFQPILG